MPEMRIKVVQCGMCKHYDSEQYCEVWEQYITNDAFYCACGLRADRKTEPSEHRDCINCEDASDCAKCRGFEDEQTERSE